MSYTFLLEQGEESSAESFSAIPASVLSRLNLTAKKSCSNASATESCQSSPSGTMFGHSTVNRGEGKSIASAVASPARTYQAQDQVQESTASGRACGLKWQELFVRWDRASFSWKTHRCLWEEVLPWSSVTLPQWCLMQGGVCWALVTSEDRTEGTACGSLPTPTASDWKRTPMKRSYAERPQKLGVPDDLAKWAVRKSGLNHARLVPDLWEWAMAWPETWAQSKPLEMDRFQSWRQRHSAFFREE